MVFGVIEDSAAKSGKAISIFGKTIKTIGNDINSSSGFEKFTSIFKKDIGYTTTLKDSDSIIKDFNDHVRNGTLTNEEFDGILKRCDKSLGDYLTKVRDSGKTTQAYNVALKNATLSSMAFRAASIALNAALSFGIGVAISFAIEGIIKLANAQKEAIEQSEEAIKKYKESMESLKKNKETIDSISPDYEKLSKGVSDNGKNISLTADEYKRYNEIVSKIAETFPSMIEGYTKEGIAILKHKGNVEKLTEAYEDQKRAADEALLRDAPKILKGYNEKINSRTSINLGNAQVGEKEEFAEVLIKNLDSLDNIKRILKDYESVGRNSATGVLSDLGIGYNGLWTDIFGTSDETAKLIQSKGSELISYQKSLVAEINAETDKVRPLIDAIIETDVNYNKLSKESQDLIKQITNSLDIEIIKSFEDKDVEMKVWLQTNLIEPIYQNEGTLKDSFKNIFDLKKSFDDNKIKVNEFEETVKEASKNIFANLSEEQKKSFWMKGINEENIAERLFGLKEAKEQINDLKESFKDLNKESQNKLFSENNLQTLKSIRNILNQIGNDDTKVQIFAGALDNADELDKQIDKTLLNIKNLGDEGIVAADKLTKAFSDPVDAQNALIDAYNITSSTMVDIQAYADTTGKSVEDLGYSFEKVFSTFSDFLINPQTALNDMINTVSSLSEEMIKAGKSAQEWIDKCNKIKDMDVSSKEYYDTMQDIALKYPDLVTGVDAATGAYTLQDGAIEEVKKRSYEEAEQKRQTAKIQAIIAQNTLEQYKIELEKNIEKTKSQLKNQKSLGEGIIAVLEVAHTVGSKIPFIGDYINAGLGDAITSAKNKANAKYKEIEDGINSDQTKINELNKSIEWLNGQITKLDGLNNVISNYSPYKGDNYSTKKQKDENTALKEYLALLEHKKSLGQYDGKELQYIADLEYAYKSLAKTQEEKWSLEEKIYQQRKEYENQQLKQLDDAQKAINNLVKLRIEMIKKEKALEKDALNEQKKAQKEKLDGIKKEIDARKEALSIQKNDYDEAKNLEEKQKQVYDLNAQLIALDKDNSAEATKKKLELKESLTKAQENLDSYLYDQSIKKQQDALDKEYDARQEEYNLFEKQIDDKLLVIEDYLNNQENLIKDAMNSLNGMSSSMYQQLMDWNLKYGDGIRSTIADAWKEAADALSKYGSKLNFVGTLENIDNKIKNPVSVSNYSAQATTPASSGNKGSLSKGQTVTVSSSATNFSSKSKGVKMASSVPGGSYTVYQVEGNEVLIGRNGVYTGWVNIGDLKYHTGAEKGIVGGISNLNSNAFIRLMLGDISPVLNSNEVPAILEKEEAVVTRMQMNNFMNKTLPSLMGLGQVQGGVPIINMGDINIQGNADSDTIKQLQKFKKDIVNDTISAINKVRYNRGYTLNAKSLL